jgi:RimJ/RimL family protein N-acetyltransferase
MYIKKLIGTNCYLSPIDPGDAEQFTIWLNDMEITTNLPLYDAVISAGQERTFLEQLSKEHHYSIIDREKDVLLGNCGFTNLDTLNQNAEAGICIGNKAYWNKGYGTEALSLLADYGFKALNLHAILIKVYSYNQRAQRCYEKVGFKPIGIRREALYRNLTRHDIVYMDLLVSDFYRKN